MATTSTERLYLLDTYQYELEGANFLEILPPNPDDKINLTAVVLDKTIFHPQGGGQPSDIGKIMTETCTFEVEIVKAVGNTLHHYGKFSDEENVFKPGDFVNLQINQEKRNIYARLHSAGHAIDVSVAKMGYDLKPTKGYHFLDGPFVEYEGTVPAEDREEFIKKVNEDLVSVIDDDIETTVEYMTNEELEKVSKVESSMPGNEKLRVVTVANFACPCGGTHVKKSKEIGKIEVTRLKNKKGVLKVSYKIEGQ